MGIHFDLEGEIVKYIKNHDKLPTEFGGRVGREGNDLDLSSIEQPFIMVQLLNPQYEIHSLGDWAKDVDFITQITVFNENKVQQKTLYESIANIFDDSFKININEEELEVEVLIKSINGFDGDAGEAGYNDLSLFKNMVVLNGELSLVKGKGNTNIIY